MRGDERTRSIRLATWMRWRYEVGGKDRCWRADLFRFIFAKVSQLAGYGMYTLSRGERRRRIKSLHIRRFLLQVSFLRCFCLGPLCTNSQIQCKEPLLKGSLRE